MSLDPKWFNKFEAREDGPDGVLRGSFDLHYISKVVSMIPMTWPEN